MRRIPPKGFGMAVSQARALAVVLEAPEHLHLRALELTPMGPDDVCVAASFSGISTGTERLLWSGRMPPFPGMGYPLVPGYETVGRVVEAGEHARALLGREVFVPGANCYRGARGLFGGAAARLIVPAARVVVLPEALGEDGVLLALAATAQHALAGGPPPDLVVGHGVLGRLIARLSVAAGHPPPVVWETNPARRDGARGYRVIDPSTDDRRDHAAIIDASGAAGLLDTLIARLAKGGEICLAGFYEAPLSFHFPMAFMREMRLRVAAEWKPGDVAAVLDHLAAGRLSLGGLITHRRTVAQVDEAYRTAFADPECLKMIVDWRTAA